MVPIGDVPNLEALVDVLGCKLSALPMTYLGLPLGAKFNSKLIWNTIIEKMERKLGGWKRLYLSKGEKIQRDFLWNGLGDQPKFHLVNWSKVVAVKHGDLWGGWCTKLPQGAYGEAFPALYSIALNKEAAVADYMQFSHGNLSWEVEFVRNLQDWELDSLVSFLARLYLVSLNDSGLDQTCWQWDSKSEFSVHSYYRCLHVPIAVQFPWKGVWKSKAEVASFLWTAIWGKILTNDNLRKRRVVLVDWCCLCKNAGESSDHIFLHYTLAKLLWDSVCTLFGIHWVMPRTMRDLAESSDV
uniref:Reverse transcriptase zinc-binding domain-containing protein n=1 Tax=Fagus sylvatica TaxID=28930 RepID=A0A2N9GZ95_FAGSY